MAKSKENVTQKTTEENVVQETNETPEVKTYTQEEVDQLVAAKLAQQQESIVEPPEFIQDNPEGEEMVVLKLDKHLGLNDDPRGEYVAINGVAMFVPRGKVCKIKKKYAERLLMSLKLRDIEESYIRTNEGDKEITL
jgi:hypothetical protein